MYFSILLTQYFFDIYKNRKDVDQLKIVMSVKLINSLTNKIRPFKRLTHFFGAPWSNPLKYINMYTCITEALTVISHKAKLH